MTTQPDWLRSKRCDTGSCVEVAWVSANCESGNCVEIAGKCGAVLIRDSKLGEASPILHFTRDEWRAFVDEIHDLDARLSA